MLSPASNASQQPAQARRFASLFPPAKHLPDYAVRGWREQLTAREAKRARRTGGAK